MTNGNILVLDVGGSFLKYGVADQRGALGAVVDIPGAAVEGLRGGVTGLARVVGDQVSQVDIRRGGCPFRRFRGQVQALGTVRLNQPGLGDTGYVLQGHGLHAVALQEEQTPVTIGAGLGQGGCQGSRVGIGLRPARQPATAYTVEGFRGEGID